jgi:hypothetical protein
VTSTPKVDFTAAATVKGVSKRAKPMTMNVFISSVTLGLAFLDS